MDSPTFTFFFSWSFNPMVHKEILKNGLRVITAPMKSTHAVTVMAYVGTGSRYEKKEHNGISHVMEHMFFKGGKRFPNAQSVSMAVDRVGGICNAFTAEEKVAYFVKLSGHHKEIAYDLLSDMLLNAQFDPAELNRERGVIVEEIRMYNDDPMSRVAIDFQSLCFGDQPLGWDIAGPEKVIMRIGRNSLVHYLNNHYSSRNTVISAAGNISHKENLRLVDRFFQFENTRTPGKPPPFRPIRTPKIRLNYRKTEQAHFVLGFLTEGEDHPSQPALKVLGNILGGTMSSRLFVNLREKKGLAYYVRADRTVYRDVGVFRISAGVNVGKIEEAVRGVFDEVDRLCSENVPEEEIDLAKQNIKGLTDLSLEDSMRVASLYGGREVVYHSIKTPKEYLDEVDRITARDVRNVAQKVFQPHSMKFALIGPVKDRGRLEKVVRLNG
jgi:predicted Zn-dependent peptidase